MEVLSGEEEAADNEDEDKQVSGRVTVRRGVTGTCSIRSLSGFPSFTFFSVLWRPPFFGLVLVGYV